MKNRLIAILGKRVHVTCPGLSVWGRLEVGSLPGSKQDFFQVSVAGPGEAHALAFFTGDMVHKLEDEKTADPTITLTGEI
jgi:hypothetical protein